MTKNLLFLGNDNGLERQIVVFIVRFTTRKQLIFKNATSLDGHTYVYIPWQITVKGEKCRMNEISVFGFSTNFTEIKVLMKTTMKIIQFTFQ